jgi:hypothetical protein
MSTSSEPPGSVTGRRFADDDPWVDMPLWEEADEEGRRSGICRECGELVEDPDDDYCARCLP